MSGKEEGVDDARSWKKKKTCRSPFEIFGGGWKCEAYELDDLCEREIFSVFLDIFVV